MQLGPRFNQTALPAREAPSYQIDRINPVNRDLVLVVGMEVRDVMWFMCFHVHANNDAEETCELWHTAAIIPYTIMYM